MVMAKRSSRTLPLTVREIGFLLDRLGADCHPLQFLRELTQNAIEAIARTGKAGDVVWDRDEVHDLEGGSKLCIIDTGDGMAGEDLIRYINALSSSGSAQSVAGNYGVGAKIAAATSNRAGLVYLSWRAGRGSMIHLWRDPHTEQYGLRQLERPDGTFDHFAEVDDTVRPPIVKRHGTKVVLVGPVAAADTMQAPAGTPSGSHWVARYLNGRYFRFPPGVTVRAREGWEHPRRDPRNLLRRVRGQAELLAQHSESFGALPLDGATAHWWILRDEPPTVEPFESHGHTAALHQDELYELTNGRPGRARLQQFGIVVGHNRVVVYIEPRPKRGRTLTTNTARTMLLLDGEPLPWTEWAAEFRDRMPEEVAAHVEAAAAGTDASSHRKAIRERLRPLIDMYQVTRYQLAHDGDDQVDDQHRGGGARRQEEREATGSTSGARARPSPSSAGGVYAIFLKKPGSRAKRVDPDPFPETRWVTVANGGRVAGDMEDRAARYLAGQHLLLINGDFRVFTDMVERWVSDVGKPPGARTIVQDAVRGWFEQALVETVMGLQAMRGSSEWSAADVERALSEEGLTAAVMARYHVHVAVKREVGSKLGKLSAA